jgi:hypothetical protein
MLRRDVLTMACKMLAILHIPVSEEVGYIYLSMAERFGKSCCWNGFMIFWNVSTRLQDSEKSTYDDGVSRFSGIAICE